MSKEKIISVSFNEIPDVRIRVINDEEPLEIKKQKIKYPFELFNNIILNVETSFGREININIPYGYTWNGADIPKFFYRIIGSRTSNQFLIASMVHDYLLEFKVFILKNHPFLTINEYRRLTSLIFREILKKHGTQTIKANIMSWCVDIFQHYGNRKGWQIDENFSKWN